MYSLDSTVRRGKTRNRIFAKQQSRKNIEAKIQEAHQRMRMMMEEEGRVS